MLLEQERIFHSVGRRVLIIKYKNDNRYTHEPEIISHSQSKNQPTTKVVMSTLLCTDEILPLVQDFKAVCIDEGQFFKDCPQFLNLMRQAKKDVIVSGLSGDFKQEMFPVMGEIIPLCDKIIQLTSVCSFCDCTAAAFTVRLTEEREQEVIGGIEMYQPCCGSCLTKKSNP